MILSKPAFGKLYIALVFIEIERHFTIFSKWFSFTNNQNKLFDL